MKVEVNVEVKRFGGGNLVKTIDMLFPPPIGYMLDLEIQDGDPLEDCEVMGGTWCEDSKSSDGGRLLLFCRNSGFVEDELVRIQNDPSWKIE